MVLEYSNLKVKGQIWSEKYNHIAIISFQFSFALLRTINMTEISTEKIFCRSHFDLEETMFPKNRGPLAGCS